MGLALYFGEIVDLNFYPVLECNHWPSINQLASGQFVLHFHNRSKGLVALVH